MSRRKKQRKQSLRFELLESRRLLMAEGLISHWPLDLSSNKHLDIGPAGNDIDFVGSSSHEDSDHGRALKLSGDIPDHDRWVRFALDDGKEGEAADTKEIEIGGDQPPPPVNEAPEIAVPDGATVFEQGSEPVVVLPSVAVSDPDSPNFGGGSLRVNFAEDTAKAGDFLSVKTTEQILIDGDNVFDRSADPPTRIAEVNVAEHGGSVLFHFNEHVSHDLAELIARTVHFGNSVDEPQPGVRLVRFELADGDGDGGTDADTRRVELGTSNDAPIVEFSDGATRFSEDGEAVIVDAHVEVADPDSPNFGGGKLIVTFVEQSRREGDSLGIRGSAAMLVQGNDLREVVEGQSIKIADFGFNEAALVIEFNEDADAATVQKVARQITFGNELPNPNHDDRLIRFTVTDGDGGTGADMRRIEFASVNDAPVVEFADGPSVLGENNVVLVDQRVEVGDPDSPNFDGGQLVVFFDEQSRREGDHVGLLPAEDILLQGSDIRLVVEGQSIKVAEVSFTAASMIIDFNTEANAAAVQKIARRVNFTNDLAQTQDGDRFIKFVLTDGDGGQGSDVKRIAVERPNAHPVVDVVSAVTVFEVSEDPVIIAPHLEIFDLDSDNFAGGNLTVAIIEQSFVDGDFLVIRPAEGILVEANQVFLHRAGAAVPLATFENIETVGDGQAVTGISLVFTLTEHATAATTERLARQIVFGSTTESLGDNVVRFVRFAVEDGDGGSGADVKRIELVFRPDDDLDGVDDDVEDEAPFNGDGNQDGVPDSEQDHVASVRGEDDHFVTFSTPEETRLVNVQLMGDPSPNDRPEDTQFPVGFFDFEVEGVDSATATVVTVHLEPGANANSYYVFGPTPDNPNSHWYPFHYDGETGAKIFGDRIEIHYMDGKRGDSDLTENGIIADPGAPALSSAPWRNPTLTADVNRDGKESALDALLIINDIAFHQARSLPWLPTGVEQLAEFFFDVSGNNAISSLDALRVINILAENLLRAQEEAEFISSPVVAAPLMPTTADDDDDERVWDDGILGIGDELV